LFAIILTPDKYQPFVLVLKRQLLAEIANYSCFIFGPVTPLK